ncbi:MAG TPA: lytic transglycosylase domain-containing protein [Solirubrobacteraceae bacterium]|nr:lytic transglycosylase domain-containing protein [Solirubrobacteraceae bacterium]
MSTLALGAAAEPLTAGEPAALARVKQLQELIEKTRAAATGSTYAATGGSSAGEGTFASALQAASAPSTAYASFQPQASGETGSSQYDSLIEAAAARNNLDPALLHGLIQQESGFDPNSRSSAGAEGLTQLMPGTASSLGVSNPLDPAESIEGGARYLAEMMSRFGGNTADALAAYNAGPGAVAQYGGVPPYAETQSYVQKVMGYAESYRLQHPATTSLGSVA